LVHCYDLVLGFARKGGQGLGNSNTEQEHPVPTVFNAKTPGRQDAKRLKMILCVLAPLRLCVENLVTGEKVAIIDKVSVSDKANVHTSLYRMASSRHFETEAPLVAVFAVSD